jgi:hypothetical protein
LDELAAKKLWLMSEELSGVKFQVGSNHLTPV